MPRDLKDVRSFGMIGGLRVETGYGKKALDGLVAGSDIVGGFPFVHDFPPGNKKTGDAVRHPRLWILRQGSVNYCDLSFGAASVGVVVIAPQTVSAPVWRSVEVPPRMI